MLDKQDIDHIAELARLDLSEEEKGRYREQLSSVLDYIGQLQEVDTNGVEITAQVSGLADVYRADEVQSWNEAEREAALGQAPAREDRQIKVKRVLEHVE